MEYVAVILLWTALLFLAGWQRALRTGRKTVLLRRGFVLCTLLFAASAFLWNYCFR